MAKKKAEEENDSSLDIAKLYTLGEWSGQTQYKCNLCPFDAMRLEGILSHIETVHLPGLRELSEPKRAPAGILVADKNGNVKSGAETGLIGVYEIDLKEVLDGTNNPGENNG